MREIRVYNEAREPVWRGELAAGEVAVFHVDAVTGRHRNAHGRRIESHWERTCLVFPSFEAGVEYATRRVREVPSLTCRIFGAAEDEPLRVVVDERVPAEHDQRRILKRGLWGLLLVAVGILGIWIDWLFDWFYILGVIIGTKFLTVGIVRLVESIHHHLTLRAAQRNRATGSPGRARSDPAG